MLQLAYSVLSVLFSLCILMYFSMSDSLLSLLYVSFLFLVFFGRVRFLPKPMTIYISISLCSNCREIVWSLERILSSFSKCNRILRDFPLWIDHSYFHHVVRYKFPKTGLLKKKPCDFILKYYPLCFKEKSCPLEMCRDMWLFFI